MWLYPRSEEEVNTNSGHDLRSLEERVKICLFKLIISLLNFHVSREIWI